MNCSRKLPLKLTISNLFWQLSYRIFLSFFNISSLNFNQLRTVPSLNIIFRLDVFVALFVKHFFILFCLIYFLINTTELYFLKNCSASCVKSKKLNAWSTEYHFIKKFHVCMFLKKHVDFYHNTLILCFVYF